MRNKYRFGYLLAVLLAVPALPEVVLTPEAMLGAALHEERVTLNLRGAIDGYRRLLASKGVPRPVAAQALFHIGLCQQKLSDPEAGQTFQGVVQKFSDQKDLAAQAQAKLKAAYRYKAIVAVLPGNPIDSRLYSLQRDVMTQEFLSHLERSYSVKTPGQRLMVSWKPESLIQVTFSDEDSSKAVAVVKATMDALINEMENRRAYDAGYGTVGVQSPARQLTAGGAPRAEGVIRMEGIHWGPAEKQKTRSQITALIATFSDLDTLRHVAGQGPDSPNNRSEVDGIARQVRATMSFHPRNDSWLEVTLASSDPTFLSRLLDYVPKGTADLTGRLPLADIDFVPTHMRNAWYIFNCCKIIPN